MQSATAHRPLTLLRRLEGADRRRHRRIEWTARVRGLDADGNEFEAVTVDVAAGGLRLNTARPMAVGDEVVLYIDEIGRVEGMVSRILREFGVAIAFRIPARKRDKIADQLTWLINRDRLNLNDERLSERRPGAGEVIAVFGDNISIPCTVQDMSIFGVALRTSGKRPLIGQQVKVASRTGVCARYVDGGFAVDFRSPAAAD